MVTTAGQNTISQGTLAAVPIRLAPVAEQKRIVAKVDELIARSRRAKEALDAVHPLLDQLRQSILATAFRGDLTADWRAKNPNVESGSSLAARTHVIGSYKRLRKVEKSAPLHLDDALFPEVPASWAYRTVQELFDAGLVVDFADGNHGALYPRRSEFGSVGVLFVTAQQIEDGEVRFEKSPRLDASKAASLRKGWARGGDVLLTHNATVGRTALVPLGVDEFLLGTSVTFYRLNESGLDRDWFYYYLTSSTWQAQLHAVMAQTTRDQVSIQKQAFFRVPVPPLEEQREIARRLSVVLSYCARSEAAMKTCAARAPEFESAILLKAFRGELVPQDPSDEPASVLLDRIRAARDSGCEEASGALRRSRKAERVIEALSDDEQGSGGLARRSDSAGAVSTDLSEIDSALLKDEVSAALWTLGPLEKQEAVRRVADRLRQSGHVDFQRLRADGPLFGQILDAIEAAVKAGHLDRPTRGHVRACKADATAYTPDDWRHALVASLGTDPVDRDDAIRAAAEWARDNLGLEFARLREDGHIVEGLRSALNSAIRRGDVIRRDAKLISRKK